MPAAAASRTSANSRSTPSRGRNTVGSSRTSSPCPRPTDARISSIARTIASSARSTGLSVGRRARRVDARRRTARSVCARPRALAPPRDAEARARRGELGDAQVLEHAQRLDRGRGPGARSSCRARGTAPARAAAGPARRRSASSPASGSWKPARILISVDLPEPFSPSRPWTSPGSTSRSTPRSALRPAEALRQAPERQARAAARPSTATSGPRASGSRRRTSCPSRR